MKKQFTLLFLLFSSLCIVAQDTTIQSKHLIWGVYPSLIYYHKDFKSINSANWMLRRPGDNELMSGFGVNYGNPRLFYASVDLTSDILHEDQTSGRFGSIPAINVECYNYRLSVNTYYAFVRTQRYGVYGNLGTSFERILLRSENHNTTNTTDTFTVFENSVIKQNFLLNAGLSLYFYDKKMNFSTGTLAIKIGYDWAPAKASITSWYEYDGNTKKVGSPAISFNGFYIGLVLNIWHTPHPKAKLH